MILGDDRHRNDAMTDPTPRPDAPQVGGRLAKAFYVLISVPILGFTGYNFWRLLFDGEIYIRYRGDFVAPDGSVYFWVTLLFYAVMFFASGIVLALFCSWVLGALKRRG